MNRTSGYFTFLFEHVFVVMMLVVSFCVTGLLTYRSYEMNYLANRTKTALEYAVAYAEKGDCKVGKYTSKDGYLIEVNRVEDGHRYFEVSVYYKDEMLAVLPFYGGHYE